MAALSCPRCAVPTRPRTLLASLEGPAVVADLCTLCGGVFLDGFERKDGLPPLGDLAAPPAARPGEAAGRRCPRCPCSFATLTLLDVELDVCRCCGGVWLDGGEYEALARAADAEQENPGEKARGPYRARAVEAARTLVSERARCAGCGLEMAASDARLGETGLVCAGCDVVSCVRCGLRARASDTYVSDAGPVCPLCYPAEQRRLETESRSSDAAVAEAMRQGQDPLDALVRGVAGLLARLRALVDAGPRCATCGARAASRCGHAL